VHVLCVCTFSPPPHSQSQLQLANVAASSSMATVGTAAAVGRKQEIGVLAAAVKTLSGAVCVMLVCVCVCVLPVCKCVPARAYINTLSHLGQRRTPTRRRACCC
jgi:hypothetical protein